MICVGDRGMVCFKASTVHYRTRTFILFYFKKVCFGVMMGDLKCLRLLNVSVFSLQYTLHQTLLGHSIQVLLPQVYKIKHRALQLDHVKS